ncbi:PREDICTED: Retrovirus-related Pol poly from transposon [Prunus dulcis]|uniref:PREDICTED: Retrovirus-related Pol poly from transposon n=1 Tax=Prunus dulcis TaxID=3755 RepID=A0A5E4EXJ3_PRUDU|nr:PREDICTED: Retrovirus-related Pol poly from transposon [Prunus dulcis]
MLHGYPPGHPKHKSNRSNRGGNRSQFDNSNNSAHSSVNHVKESPTMQEMQSVMNGLSDLQFQQILSIMNNKWANQSSNPKANAAGTSSSLSQAPLGLHRLILDSGATDYITSSPNLLVNCRQNIVLPPVIMSSGEQAPITSTGTLPLNSVISLKNVLGVPSFKVDLMSVSQVTRGLNCSITFFPYWCILQDLTTKTTIGLGKQ